MARALRTDRVGAWHHVMHRGARREAIFRADEHCLLFLGGLAEAVERLGLEVHAYALLPNHYHLLVRSPRGSLSRAMKHVNATYTQRLNQVRGWDGPLFRGRFRSQLIEDERHLDQVFAYIHLNPFRAGLAKRLDDPCWTSLRAYLGRERPPEWLETELFAARLGGAGGVAESVRALRKDHEVALAALDPETGWVQGPQDRAPRRAARAERVARPAVGDVLKAVAEVSGGSVADLKRREMGPGANPARRLAVWALNRAGLTHGEIGKALGASEGQVTKVLWRLRQDTPPEPLAAWMAELRER